MQIIVNNLLLSHVIVYFESYTITLPLLNKILTNFLYLIFYG